MALRIVTPPVKLPVALEDMKAHLRVDGTESDALITRQIAAIAHWLAGRHGCLGRSLIRQTLALTVPLPIVPEFTGPAISSGMTGITLPRPPVIEVASVEMIDSARQATLIAPAGYTTFEGNDGLTHLVFLLELRWPVIAAGPAFVRVTYDAGYGPEPEDVDPGLQHAIMMAVSRLHEARGDPMAVSLQDDLQIARMFAPYRVCRRG